MGRPAVIWCLPGFLGRPEDFDPLAAACSARSLPRVRAVSLLARRRPQTLAGFGAAFTRRVARADRRPLALGYSLGGRLALHALLADPGRWRGAIIVSAHLGYERAAERAARRAEDETWARRFEEEPWDSVLAAWDARPTFGGRPRDGDRPAHAFSRRALAHALRVWGLGRQAPLARRLAAITCPVLWIAGARDRRFLAQAERAMQYLPRGALAVAPGAMHRVPWEAPGWFHTSVCAFLQALSD